MRQGNITIKDVWVNGHGNPSASLMLVGEAPGYHEALMKRVLSGPLGLEVDNMLTRCVGVQLDDTYVTNTLKYPIRKNKKIYPSEMDMARNLLQQEIEKVRPKVILAMGAPACKALLDTTYDMETLNGVPHRLPERLYVDETGSPYNTIVIPSFHPAAAYKDMERYAWTVMAFESAKRALNRTEDVWTEIRNRERAKGTELLPYLKVDGDYIALDTETQEDGSPYLVSASGSEGTAFVCEFWDAIGIDHINTLLQNRTAVLHHALFDLPVLRNIGIRPKKWVDTMVMAFLLQTLPMGLKELTYHFFGLKMRLYEEVVGDWPDLTFVDHDEAFAYSAQDADATIRCFNKLQQLRYPNMDKVLNRDMRCMPMLIAMMRNGFGFDTEYMRELEGEVLIHNLETLDKVREVGGKDYNPGSAPQNADLLYRKLRLGKDINLKKTAKGQKTTNTNALKRIEEEHEVVTDILKWKETNTLLTRYLGKLPDRAKENRIHTTLSLIRVKHSGRIASSKPNLMAQPTRTEYGKRIRNAFIARPGYQMVSFDYNQMEMRLMAHLSGDAIMKEFYIKGQDVHTQTAMKMFGIATPEEVDEMKHRYPAKRTGFGIIYGISAHGLSREMSAEGGREYSEEECQVMLDAWFKVYYGIQQYIEEVKNETKRYRFTLDMWGRRELLPEVISVSNQIREAALRKSVNQRVQSGAQGIIKEAMGELTEQILEWNEQKLVFPLLQIHDSLEVEMREDFMKEACPIIKHTMESVVQLSVPVRVDIKAGDRWGSEVKWKG